MVLTVLAAVVLAGGAYYVFIKLARRYIISKVISSSINFAVQRRFEALRKDIRILCLGTCEFRAGIDARKIAPDAFNFSIPLISFVEYYFFLKSQLDEMPNLKLLVLSTHLNSFCSRSADGSAAPMIFSKYTDLRELMPISNPATWGRLLWRKFFYSSDLAKIKGGTEVIMENLRKNVEKNKAEPRISQRTWAPRGPGGTVADEDAEAGVKKHFSRPTFDARALICFEKILKLCREKKIPVITVTMPCSEKSMKFIKEFGYVTDDEILRRIVNDPAYKDLICRHLDYTRLFHGRDDLFLYEGWELNGAGNQALSARLAEELSGIMNEMTGRSK